MRQFIICTLCGIFAIFLFPQISIAQLKTEQLTQEKSKKPDRKFIVGIQELGFGSKRKFNIAPYFGYKLNKHFTLGAQFRFFNSNFTFDDSGSSVIFNRRKFGYSLFGRYTLNPDNKLSFFAEFSVGQDFDNIENNISPIGDLESLSFSDFSSRLGLGLKYRINNRFDILLDVGNVFYNFTSNNLNLNFDFGLRSFSPRFEIKF